MSFIPSWVIPMGITIKAEKGIFEEKVLKTIFQKNGFFKVMLQSFFEIENMQRDLKRLFRVRVSPKK